MVNRATFYDHYGDKFALLECMVAERFDGLLTEREIQYDGTCASALRATFLALCDYLAGVLGAGRSRTLEPHMESAIIAVLRRMFLQGIQRHDSGSAIPPEMRAAAVSWAIYGAAKEWAQMPEPEPPEEVAEMVTNLVAPVLQAGRAQQASPEDPRRG